MYQHKSELLQNLNFQLFHHQDLNAFKIQLLSQKKDDNIYKIKVYQIDKSLSHFLDFI